MKMTADLARVSTVNAYTERELQCDRLANAYLAIALVWVERNANRGLERAYLSCPLECRTRVISLLKEHGYEVNVSENHINISW